MTDSDQSGSPLAAAMFIAAWFLICAGVLAFVFWAAVQL